MSKDIEKRISGKGRQGGSMNIRFSGFSNSLQSLNRRQSLTNILLNKQNVGQSGKKDLFVRSTTYDAGTYTISAGQRRKMIPGSVLAAMNNDIYVTQNTILIVWKNIMKNYVKSFRK